MDILYKYIVKYGINEKVISNFRKEVKLLDNEVFCSELSVVGYIPDIYSADSSEETLYSKLVELIVCEWATRIGFKESFCPTQKSSKEDITIIDKDNLIVSDAKSFRLSRSQSSPNVKDVIKQGDYTKWLKNHQNTFNKLGGLITFPYLHDNWVSSDVHSYLTYKENPILYLYYEDLAAFLSLGITKEKILDYFLEHKNMYPNIVDKKNSAKEKYLQNIEKHFFDDSESLTKYKKLTSKYRKNHTNLIEQSIKLLESDNNRELEILKNEINKIDSDKKIDFLIDKLYNYTTKDNFRKIKNIKKFRK
jgi:hypothetical protein